MAYTRRTYTPRSLKPDRTILNGDPHVENIDSDDYNLDEQLELLAKKVVRRLHQEIVNYSVPQLLSGLHKCLQVRVLMATLRAKGGGDNVGSAVKRYSAAFSPADDTSGRKSASRGRGRSRAAFTDEDDTIVQLVTDD